MAYRAKIKKRFIRSGMMLYFDSDYLQCPRARTMKRPGIFKRFIVPLAFVVGVWAISRYAYEAAGALPPDVVRTTLINVFGPLLFISVWFFAFVGPPWAYIRGATFLERFIIAFANPVIWFARVESRVACQFSTVEMIYFFFLPWTFGLMCVTFFELGVSEVVCRTIHKIKAPREVRIFHPLVLIFLIGGLAGTYIGLIKGQEWVYTVVHHYAEHFLN